MKKAAVIISLVALLIIATVLVQANFFLGSSIPLHKFLWFAAGPIVLALLAFSWLRIAALRWLALLFNALHALAMLVAFGYMILKASPPPSFASTVPVLLVAIVCLIAPLANAIALAPGVWQGANNSLKPTPLRGAA